MTSTKKYDFPKLLKIKAPKRPPSPFNSQHVNFGIKILKYKGFKLTAKQIESVRQTINKQLNGKGELWVRFFFGIAERSGTIAFEVGGNASNEEFEVALKKVCSE